MSDELLGHGLFTDGTRRPSYQDAAGMQYVLDDDGARVHGVFLIPDEEPCDVPVIVPTGDGKG
jgi:hypothetical protein